MKLRQSGFIPLFELVLIGIAVAVMVVAGTVWWRAANVQVSVQKGWATYRSTHSSMQFQYPASWKLTVNAIDSVQDPLSLESATLTGDHGFTLNMHLSKTDHNVVVHTASCVLPPKVNVLTQLQNNLEASYSSYSGNALDLWLASIGTPPAGYGYATGQCRPRGNDFAPLPNDLYATLIGSYNPDTSVPVADFLARADTKTAVAIFKTFKY